MFYRVVVVVVTRVVGRAGCLSHGIPYRAVLSRGEPGHVAREIVVVSVGFVWLQVKFEAVFPSLGRSSRVFGTLFCLVGIAGFQLQTSLAQRSSWRMAIIFACLQKSGSA